MTTSINADTTARQQFRALLSSVPPGMTPDQALELRMALMRDAEAKAGRGISAAIWLGALVVDALIVAFVFTSGA